MAAKIGKTVGESQPYWPDTPKRPKEIRFGFSHQQILQRTTVAI